MTRVTQTDIAKELGLHVTTVSKALAGHPDVAAETRQKVSEAATRLGYVPDPLLKVLASYRSSRRPRNFQSVLGWVCNYPAGQSMKRFADYEDYFEGARRRAEEFGYKLDRFYVERDEGSYDQLVRTLEARGVRGVIIAPQARESAKMPCFPWHRFSAVTIGLTLVEPRLHVVTNDHFHTILCLLDEVRSRGYRRIGCYLRREDNERIEGRFGSALASCLKDSTHALELYDEGQKEDFLSWFRSGGFDLVITGESQVVNWLREVGVEVPGNCGVAHYAVSAKESVLSGMEHNNSIIGAGAMDVLNGLMHRGETGPPTWPLRTMVPCRWIAGTTVTFRP